MRRSHPNTPSAACTKEFHWLSRSVWRVTAPRSTRTTAWSSQTPARRDGRFIELVGRYNPLTNPKTIDIDLEKVDMWIERGAQPTSAVAHLIDIARDGSPAPEKKQKLSKKAAAKAASSEE